MRSSSAVLVRARELYQCNLLHVCPHAVIRPVAMTKEEAENI